MTGRVMISAAGSSAGKSVVTMGLLCAMKEQGIRAAGFKCGPDYIDPGFHERVLGIPCRNLDTYLMGNRDVLEEVSDAERSGFLVAAEGAMGLYDGLGGGIRHSAYSIASLCRMPVVVVLDALRKDTCLDQLKLLLDGDSERLICGVIINRCPEEEYPDILRRIRKMLSTGDGAGGIGTAEKTDIAFCGFLPPLPEAEFPSRHLGLVRAAENRDFSRRVKRIGEFLQRCGCVDEVLSIARRGCAGADSSRKYQAASSSLDRTSAHAHYRLKADALPDPAGDLPVSSCCRIAVARDEAFSFVYQRSLENLERAGAQLEYFSPIHDEMLPEGMDGLYLPGGYPELYAPLLEKNRSMLSAVRSAVRGGVPTVAECGGFLYLGEKLCADDGTWYRMAGVFDGWAARQERLVRFGYLELIQEKGDSLLFREGEPVAAHEFHYWDSDCCGEDLTARKRSKNQTWKCGYAGPDLYAAFPHLYLDAVRAERFVRACMRKKDGYHAGLKKP